MIRFQPDELSQPAKIHLVANTPQYLYKKLRGDSLVQRVVNISTTADIVEALSSYGKEGDNSEVSPIAVYVLLAALSFKPLSEYKEFLDRFDPPIAWIPELRGILFESATANSVVVGSMINLQPLRPIRVVATNTTTKKLIVGGE